MALPQRVWLMGRVNRSAGAGDKPPAGFHIRWAASIGGEPAPGGAEPNTEPTRAHWHGGAESLAAAAAVPASTMSEARAN
ncbi:hypothetical protein EYF80_012615 [Liparis tanakae]|uniref:Uncharacterized protein n=1 Tax=Liparis tanakae TaxID=230148 RepID=A0A4Z2IGQ7_9TELE|nr:hypothetical protein EYF80_012615 [Liparis tanakae]